MKAIKIYRLMVLLGFPLLFIQCEKPNQIIKEDYAFNDNEHTIKNNFSITINKP